jgi:hypothetical protein
LSLLQADLRDILSAIRVPTSVVARRGCVGTGYIADPIEGARFVEVASDDQIIFGARAGKCWTPSRSS